MSDERAVEVLALIPARAGSKGVVDKNIRPLGGKPLITWTVAAARKSELVTRVVVSTDCPRIADTAAAAGAERPFLRPVELAADDTPDLPVAEHALRWLAEKEGYRPSVLVWLRPTAPLRSSDDIDAAVALLQQTGADAVRSVTAAHPHPYWTKTLEGDRLAPFVPGHDETRYPRRQLLPPCYGLNGAVDVTRPTTVARGVLFGGDVRGYVMPPERSADIDRELDFDYAELLMRRRRP